MTAQTNRNATIQAALMIGTACLSFIIGGVLFCLSIGAGITNEGYAEGVDSRSRIDQTWLILSLIFVTLSIFLFWIGLYRLAHVTDETRQPTSIKQETPTT